MKEKKKAADIWKTLLEKTAKGHQFPSATVIRDKDKSYQVFEVLVAETLARVAPEWEWSATQGSGDGGIDFFATLKRQVKTPFVPVPINQLLLGQVKRRQKSYRYDEFCSDINQIFDLYTSVYRAQNYSLFELLFVVSTDHQNNILSLRKHLETVQNNTKTLVFAANLRSPIHIVDAKDLIQYWSLNFDFVHSLLHPIAKQEELVQLRNYLQSVRQEGFGISVTGKMQVKMGELFERLVTISAASSNIPLSVFLRWRPFQGGGSAVQLVRPLQALENRGMPFQICVSGEFRMAFRCLQESNFNLGELDIITNNQELVQSIPLGQVSCSRGLMPIYQMHPQKVISEKLRCGLSNYNAKFQVMTIRGTGGVGKSTLISDLVILFANQANICIDIQQHHSILSPGDLVLNLFVQLLMSQMKKPLFSDSYLQELKWHLASTYVEKWTTDLNDFFQGKDGYCSGTVCKALVSLIIHLSTAQPIIIWLSDLHWIDQKSASVLADCINTLEQNQQFLTNRVAFLLEGRSNELLEEEYKTYHPIHWKGLIQKLKCPDLTLKPWNYTDCRNFVSSLLQISERGKDRALYERLATYLVEHSAGTPMFIIEQIRLLIGLEKLTLDTNGTVHIQDAQWNDVACTDIMGLIKRRVMLFLEKHSQYGTLIALYAHLSIYASDSLKEYIVRQINQLTPYTHEIAMEYDMFTLHKGEVSFSHEYFSQEFARSQNIDQGSLQNVISYLEGIRDREDGDTVCLLLLLDMCSKADRSHIAGLAAPLFLREDKDWIAVNLLLCRLPESVLHGVGLHKRAVLYGTVSSLMRAANYTSSEEYAQKLYNLPIESIKDEASWRYHLLACQQLSNIAASKLYVGQAISYAEKGSAQLSSLEQRNGSLNESLRKMKAALESRLAVCHLFAGDKERALVLHKALCQKPGTDDAYVLAKLGYEYNGILLHEEPEQAVKELKDLYTKAKAMPEMYPTEFYLIDVMRMVGDLILCDSPKDAINIYYDSVALAKELERNESKYISASNFLVMSASYLLAGGDVERALSDLFHACEHAIDLQREEVLWKCYINIAQLYGGLGNRKEARNYAQKTFEIIRRTLESNQNAYRRNLLRLFSQPLSILKQLCAIPKDILEELSQTPEYQGSLHVRWQNCILFLMK